jgi:hypothetical protein
MPRILTKLKIDEVSAVSRGAGQGCTVVLAKRDDEKPPEGSARELLWLAEQQIRRSEPSRSIREVRALAWQSLSDADQVRLLREESEMKKIDSSELLADWYSRLDASERRRYRSQQALIDAEMDAEGTSSRDSEGHGGGQFNGRPTSPNIAPGAPKAPVFAKGDTLRAIVKSHGLVPLCKLMNDEQNGFSVSESDLMVLAGEHAAEQGQTLGKFLNSNSGEAAIVNKAASLAREGAYARQAQANILGARLRRG